MEAVFSGHMLWDPRPREGLPKIIPVYNQHLASHMSEEMTSAPGSSHYRSMRDSELNQISSQNCEREDLIIVLNHEVLVLFVLRNNRITHSLFLCLFPTPIS